MKHTSGIFYYIVGLFFFWGFVAASNDVLIPVFKDYLKIEQWQSQMIPFVFYVAYTIGSILYLLISIRIKKDWLTKIGYTKGLSIGLFISFLGTLLFIPASINASFVTLILGLFIIGLGFSLQQTAANPLVILAGDESLGSQRLSLAGGINNIGTTIGPILVSYAVFGNAHQINDLSHLMYPYLILGFLFILIAIFFYFMKFNFSHTETSNVHQFSELLSVVKNKKVVLSMLAIFLYVGVEVSSAANLAEFAKHKSNISTSQIAPFISLYWACLMIGRWASASDIFAQKKWFKYLFKVAFPLLAFALFYLILVVNQKNIPHLEYLFLYIALLILMDFLSKGDAARQLVLYSLSGAVLILAGMLSNGIVSVFNITAVGLFCSTLWPCIFEIALKGNQQQSGLISSLLIMMIMGGGWISLLQGYLSIPLGISGSYIIGIICFLYLLLYGWYAMKTEKNVS